MKRYAASGGALIGLCFAAVVTPAIAADAPFFGENTSPQAAATTAATGPLVGVNPTSGAAIATIPFELNSARGDIQPDLALHYAKDVEGDAGLGWSLSLPSIERKPVWGLPNYANDPGTPAALAHTDRMRFDGQDLVPLGLVGFGSPPCPATPNEQFPSWATGWWYFRLQAGDSTARFFWAPTKDSWRILWPNGHVWEFGVSSADANDQEGTDREGGNVFRWNLVRQWDSHGEFVNPIVYKWQHLGTLGRGYLVDMFDTPRTIDDHHQDLAAWAHHVHLEYNRHPFEVTNGGNPIFGEHEYRLSVVYVTSADFEATTPRHLVRRYLLGYQRWSHHEYLTSVTPLARPEDSAGNATCVEGNGNTVPLGCAARWLPPIRLGYSGFTGDTPPDLGLFFVRGGVLTETVTSGAFPDNRPVVPMRINRRSAAYSFLVAPQEGMVHDYGTGTNYCTALFPEQCNALRFWPARGQGANRTLYEDSDANRAWGYPDTIPNGVPEVSPTYYPLQPGLDSAVGDWDSTGLDSVLFTIPSWDGKSLFSLKAASVPPDDPTSAPLPWVFRNYDPTATSYDGFPVRGPQLPSVAYYSDVNADGLIDAVDYSTVKLSRRVAGGVKPFDVSIPASNVVTPLHDEDEYAVIDMNGDGLGDMAHTAASCGGGYCNVTVVYRAGDGRGNFGPLVGMSPGKAYEATSRIPTVGGPSRRLHDVNGDGLADLLIMGRYLNQDTVQVAFNRDGLSFEDVSLADIVASGLNVPTVGAPPNKVAFIDPVGWGLDGIVFIGSRQVEAHLGVGASTTKPGMLTSYDNGRGLRATVTYSHYSELEETLGGDGIPVPLDVVSEIDTESYGQLERTRYGFKRPIFDGQRHELKGFGTVRETRRVEGSPQRTVVERRYLIEKGRERWDDDLPLARFSPLTFSVEVLGHSEEVDDPYAELPSSTIWKSTAITSYRALEDYAVGVDGRRVRLTFPEAVDTYLYDDAAFVHQDSNTRFGGTIVGPKYDRNADGVVVGSEPTSFIAGDAVPLRATVYSHLRSRTIRDDTVDFNVTDSFADGEVGVDPVIHTQFQYGVVQGTQSVWKPSRVTIEGFKNAAAEVQDYDRTFLYEYRSGSAEIAKVSALLKGSVPVERHHEDSSKAIQTNVPSASNDGWIELTAFDYDVYGNVRTATGAGGRCATYKFDDQFSQFATGTTEFSDGCNSGTSFQTERHFRREFEVEDLVFAPNGAVSRMEYDDLGRLRRVFQPHATVLGASSLALSVTYDDSPSITPTTFLQRVHAVGAFGERWSYIDGLGQERFNVDRADQSAGDPAQWIVSGAWTRGAEATFAFEPWFENLDPSTQVPSVPVQQKHSKRTLDAFGRTVAITAPDGIVIAQAAYHALSVDQRKEGATLAGSVTLNGHGQVVRSSVVNGSDVVVTQTYHLVGGEVWGVRQSHTANTSDSYYRWMQYDSFGRMVVNAEPDSTKAFSPDARNSSSVQKWIYAYDDAGRMVGTSDPRGCGANLKYDGEGRLLSEDYSPCKSSQPLYTDPLVAGADGYEVTYRYDAPEAGQLTPGPTLGRLVAVSDRGAHTRYSYDARSRTSLIERQVARPDSASFLGLARFATHTFRQGTLYDDVDRPVEVETGADVAELLVNGRSVVTPTYSSRGPVRSIAGSYGTLSTSTFDELGAPKSVTLGDRARTTLSFAYDDRHRVHEFRVDRGLPTELGKPIGSYLPPSSSPSTLQNELAHVRYTYDGRGDLSDVLDLRNPLDWPTGAKPVSRVYQYDDLHRLLQAGYYYPNSSDPQVSTFAAEDASGDVRPFPRTAIGQRVASQSFTYDWRGNIKSSDDDHHARFDRSLGNATFDPGSPDRLVSAAAGTVRAQYDEAGNVVNLVVERPGPCSSPTGKCTQRFVYDWDEIGQLSRARRWDYTSLPVNDPIYPSVPQEQAAVDLSYEYSQGVRVRKSVTVLGTPTHTLDVFGSLEVSEATWNETSKDYATGGNGAPVKESVRLGGARIAVVDDDLPTLTSGRRHVFYSTGDQLGSTSVVLDGETSELVESIQYQAYGDTESDYRPARWGSYRSEARLSGNVQDYEVGLTYFGARYYSSNLGRWISPDPLTIHGLGADLNPYAYVHGSPAQAFDIGGLSDCDGKSAGCIPPIDLSGLVAGVGQFIGGLSKAGSDVGRRKADAARAAIAAAKANISAVAQNPGNVNWGSAVRGALVDQKAQSVAYAKGCWRTGVGMLVQTRDPGWGPTCTAAVCQAPSMPLRAFERLVAAPKANAPWNVKVGDKIGSDVTGAAAMVAAAGDVVDTSAQAQALSEGSAAEAAPGAGRGAGQTFEVLDGVRRAKAAAELGQTTIEAQVQVGGKVVQTGEIPIDALRSPFKSAIDVSNPIMMQRWLRVLNGTRAGDPLPPIEVRPGANGTTIPQIQFTF